MNIENVIAAANPVPAADIPSADSPQARQTLTRILHELEPDGSAAGRPGSSRAAPGRRGPGRSGPWSRPRLGLAGLACAGVVALVVALALPGSPAKPSPPGHGPGTTASALDALAITAAAQPMTHPPGPGQFQYTDSISLNWVDTFNSPKTSYNSPNYNVSYHERRQIWIGPDGSGRIAESYTHPRLGSARDRAGWIAAGRPSLRIGPSDDRFRKHQLSVGPTNLRRLPTDPAKLAAMLSAGKIEGGPPGPAEDFVQVGDLLRETDASPALRAALFKVAERIRGTKLLGTVTDQAGRRGIGMAHWQRFAARGQVLAQVDESVLIFDPKTSALMAEETFVTYTKTGKTALTSWTVYLKSGVVDSVTSTTPVTGSGGTA